jgi:hypothetical protein
LFFGRKLIREFQLASYEPIVTRSHELSLWHQVEGCAEPTMCIEVPDHWQYDFEHEVRNLRVPENEAVNIAGIARVHVPPDLLIVMARTQASGCRIVSCVSLQEKPPVAVESQATLFESEVA